MMSKYNGFNNWPEHDAAVEGNTHRDNMRILMRRLRLMGPDFDYSLWEAFAVLDGAFKSKPPKKL